MPARPPDPARVAEAHRQRAAGATPLQIAQQLKVSERTVFRWLRTPPTPEVSPALDDQRAALRDTLAEHEAALRARRQKLGG
jgi:hypothetical protein